ncbi:hypothetical protein WMY93_000251 [Mugilogobius chulae]|uniref:C-type lectin domain-containing protein n=1 Tax=Mugilogobius chulae TaxID=88201 RepID=A0AAW0Q713_9GOBI
MEDDVQYISVVFKNKQTSQTANKDEQTIYSEVKIKPESVVRSEQPTVGAEPKPSPAAPSVPNLCVLVALGLCLCLLLGSVAALVYLSVSMTNQRSEIQRVSSELLLLQEERVMLKGQRSQLQNLTQNLLEQRERLNWTLDVILSFRQFPVADFCPNKRKSHTFRYCQDLCLAPTQILMSEFFLSFPECRPCLEGWRLFQNSCYLFHEPKPWKTWTESQTFCRQKNSDLVIVDSLQEQEFIHEHIEYYLDVYHGYWIGLSEQDQRWVWISGQEDTLGFWMKTKLGSSGPKVLVIPNQNVTESWDPADDYFFNRFICENKALILD